MSHTVYIYVASFFFLFFIRTFDPLLSTKMSCWIRSDVDIGYKRFVQNQRDIASTVTRLAPRGVPLRHQQAILCSRATDVKKRFVWVVKGQRRENKKKRKPKFFYTWGHIISFTEYVIDDVSKMWESLFFSGRAEVVFRMRSLSASHLLCPAASPPGDWIKSVLF